MQSWPGSVKFFETITENSSLFTFMTPKGGAAAEIAIFPRPFPCGQSWVTITAVAPRAETAWGLVRFSVETRYFQGKA